MAETAGVSLGEVTVCVIIIFITAPFRKPVPFIWTLVSKGVQVLLNSVLDTFILSHIQEMCKFIY